MINKYSDSTVKTNLLESISKTKVHETYFSKQDTEKKYRVKSSDISEALRKNIVKYYIHLGIDTSVIERELKNLPFNIEYKVKGFDDRNKFYLYQLKNNDTINNVLDNIASHINFKSINLENSALKMEHTKHCLEVLDSTISSQEFTGITLNVSESGYDKDLSKHEFSDIVLERIFGKHFFSDEHKEQINKAKTFLPNTIAYTLDYEKDNGLMTIYKIKQPSEIQEYKYKIADIYSTIIQEKNEQLKSIIMEQPKKELETLIGYVGQKQIVHIDSINKDVLNTTVGKPPQVEGGEWENTKLSAWGPVIDKFKDLEPGTKVMIQGIRDIDKLKKEFITVKEVEPFVKLKDLEVQIFEVKSGVGKNDKPYTNLKVYDNNDVDPVSGKSKVYSLQGYGKVSDYVTEQGLKSGDKITISAEGTPKNYRDGNNELKKTVDFVMYDVNGQNKKQEKEIGAEVPKAEKVDVGTEKKAAPKKTTKVDKGAGQQM